MAESLRGKFLVAAPQLRDPNFYKTIVLIVEHGTHGAMGLVVNRPSTVLVSHALSKYFEFCENDDLVFVGGPVEPLALFMLHSADDLAENEPSVVSGLYVGNNGDVFEEVLRRSAASMSDLKFRVFSGCAGWAPEQLEGEISRGDWHVLPACRDLVFQDDPYALYDCVLAHVKESHRILPHRCKDPRWN